MAIRFKKWAAPEGKRIQIVILILGLLLFPVSVLAGMMGNGARVVASAGTAVRLTAAIQRVRWVDIQNDCSNTALIYVGGSTVSSSSGIKLVPCATISIGSMQAEGQQAAFDLNGIFIDAAQSGEGVNFTFYSFP